MGGYPTPSTLGGDFRISIRYHVALQPPPRFRLSSAKTPPVHPHETRPGGGGASRTKNFRPPQQPADFAFIGRWRYGFGAPGDRR
jgi:hypothetical protein